MADLHAVGRSKLIYLSYSRFVAKRGDLTVAFLDLSTSVGDRTSLGWRPRDLSVLSPIRTPSL